jgi:GLPGLI family protein
VIACGTIKFERQINLHQRAKQTMKNSSFLESYLKGSDKFKTDYFKLEFETGKSLYKYSSSMKTNSMMWDDDAGMKNIVYKDFDKHQQFSMKQVFEDDFFIKDTIHDFHWKITNEYRDIAGYSCRRATTIIHDSLYVIAYYAEDIASPSGPESFGNLPGMILGLVMPRLNTTWFATDVKTQCVFEDPIEKPSKKEPVTFNQIMDKIGSRWNTDRRWIQQSLWYLLI